MKGEEKKSQLGRKMTKTEESQKGFGRGGGTGGPRGQGGQMDAFSIRKRNRRDGTNMVPGG